MTRTASIAAAAILLSAAVSFAEQAKPAAAAQVPPAKAPAPAATAKAPEPVIPITPPADYLIGIGDVLIVNIWEEPTLSTDSAMVRPDGKITLPLINDVDALGLRTDQLQVKLTELGVKFAGLKEPRVTVAVRAINSRKVYIWGGINKPGEMPLLAPMSVLQAISLAGGTKDFVNGEKIVIIREEGGKQRAIKFNLKEVQRGIKLEQNIQLRPGDTINVPE